MRDFPSDPFRLPFSISVLLKDKLSKSLKIIKLSHEVFIDNVLARFFNFKNIKSSKSLKQIFEVLSSKKIAQTRMQILKRICFGWKQGTNIWPIIESRILHVGLPLRDTSTNVSVPPPSRCIDDHIFRSKTLWKTDLRRYKEIYWTMEWIERRLNVASSL